MCCHHFLIVIGLQILGFCHSFQTLWTLKSADLYLHLFGFHLLLMDLIWFCCSWKLTELVQGVTLIWSCRQVQNDAVVATRGYFCTTYAFSVDWFGFSVFPIASLPPKDADTHTRALERERESARETTPRATPNLQRATLCCYFVYFSPRGRSTDKKREKTTGSCKGGGGGARQNMC